VSKEIEEMLANKELPVLTEHQDVMALMAKTVREVKRERLENRDYKVFKDSKAIRAISDLWAKLVRRVKGD
jgi:phytoene/squalene synthetase